MGIRGSLVIQPVPRLSAHTANEIFPWWFLKWVCPRGVLRLRCHAVEGRRLWRGVAILWPPILRLALGPPPPQPQPPNDSSTGARRPVPSARAVTLNWRGQEWKFEEEAWGIKVEILRGPSPWDQINASHMRRSYDQGDRKINQGNEGLWVRRCQTGNILVCSVCWIFGDSSSVLHLNLTLVAVNVSPKLWLILE